MKKKKIKWGKIIEAIIFVFCIGVIVHDIFIVIYALCTSQIAMFTYFGLITFIYAGALAYAIYEDFKEQIEKMSTTHNSRHHK